MISNDRPAEASNDLDSPPQTSEWLNVAEAARYLNVGERFVRRLIEERRLRFHRFGRLIRLRRPDLDAFANSNPVDPV